jgi:hypothetical protein
VTSAALRFWLRHVESDGGLWEPAGDGVLVVLSPELSRRYRLAEELTVTDDPDVARSDGVTFLGTGHPVLAEAAKSIVDAGDSGVVILNDDVGPVPAPDVLEDNARAQVPVSHGRVDVLGAPDAVTHWVLRVGVLVSYAASAEDRFTERLERWVHVDSRQEVPDAVVARLETVAPRPSDGLHDVPDSGVGRALAEADRLIEVAAVRRQAELTGPLTAAYERERERAGTYYAEAIEGIRVRLESASPDRRGLLEQRLASTEAERDRRLAEIAEKYQARHELNPYRLHLVGVPALRVPVEVRRGERRYPLMLDWLRPAGVFAQPSCPSCDRVAPLHAGKTALGCLMCMAPKVPSLPPAPAAQAAPSSGSTPPAPAASDPPAPARAASAPAPRKPLAPAERPARAAKVASQRKMLAVRQQAENLAGTVWQAVADGRTRRLRDVIAPGTPAAALTTVYGAAAIPCVLGLPAHEQPDGYSVRNAWLADDEGVTSGSVATTRNEYPYVFRWCVRQGALQVVEVLPFPTYADGRFHAYYWWVDDDNPYRVTRISPPTNPIDDVARLLLTEGGAWHGLALAARALAAWWRLSDQHDELLAAYPPIVLAAATHRLVAQRAGDRGIFRTAAEAYRADEAAVRRADTQVRRLLGLGPDRCW